MKKRYRKHLRISTVLLLVIILSGFSIIQFQDENGDSIPGEISYFSGNSNHPDSNKTFSRLGFQDHNSINVGIPVKEFKAALVDNDNTIWFLTDAGIISFNGREWELHNKNKSFSSLEMKGFAFYDGQQGQQLWIATSYGASVATLPIEDQTEVTTYLIENSPVLSNNVMSVAVGQSPLYWIGTDKGISALKMDKWLTPSYENEYPEFIFSEYPILSMATDTDGDTLYVGTDGAGVVRVFSDDVDGISGASVYAQWGPILLPSDKINSIYIVSDDEKWFGTDKGAARHIGKNTVENWTSYTADDGLVNDYVQAIAADKEGKIWLGTQGGISVFDGSSWNSYTEKDGLISNNVLCIVVDKNGVVWLGTDNGASAFFNGNFTNYR